MLITLHSYWLPIVATLIFFTLMWRASASAGAFDITPILWFIPILGVWLIYFAALYFLKP